jgi:ABC-type phosphate transport system substrate-binding protein
VSSHRYLFIFIVLTLLSARAAYADYKIVVHSSNPIDSISRDKLADIFLKKVTRWDNGKGITAIDQSDKNTVRDEFSKLVLKKEPAWVDGYWQKMIFSGRATPPARLNSDAEVLDFLRGNPDAVGYVSDSAVVGGGLKALAVRD